MRIRRAIEDDRPWIEGLIANEPLHTHTSDFYFEPGTEAHVVEDAKGPILIFRLNARVLEVDIDFDPNEKLRTARALMAGFPIVRQAAKSKNMKAMIFNSNSEKLIRFCENNFGFRPNPDYRAEL